MERIDDEKALAQITGAIDSFKNDGISIFSSADLVDRIADLNHPKLDEKLAPYGSLFKALRQLKKEGLFSTSTTQTPDPNKPGKIRQTIVYELTQKPPSPRQ